MRSQKARVETRPTQVGSWQNQSGSGTLGRVDQPCRSFSRRMNRHLGRTPDDTPTPKGLCQVHQDDKILSGMAKAFDPVSLFWSVLVQIGVPWVESPGAAPAAGGRADTTKTGHGFASLIFVHIGHALEASKPKFPSGSCKGLLLCYQGSHLGSSLSTSTSLNSR